MNLEAQLDNLINEKTSLDSITINYRNGKNDIPKLIKTSVLLLEQMMSKLGSRNIIVFPECQETSLYFLIARTIFSISVGEMSMQYDPHSFVPGEKLKIGNCIVEFVRCGVENLAGNSVERIRIKCAGDNGPPVEISLPLETAPFFQKVNTNRRLSTNKKLTEAIRQQNKFRSDNNLIELLKKHKTHMNSSIVYVSSVSKTKDFLVNTKIGNNPVSDYFSVGSLNYEGEIGNVFSGQLAGVPAIILSSQVGYVEQALANGLEVQSIIINIDEINIDNELDFLDDILEYDLPIVCVTGTLNSFKTESLRARNFNVWRWDNNTLTNRIVNDACYPKAYKVQNCRNNKVIYDKVEAENINSAFKLINKHRGLAEEGSPLLVKAYLYLLKLSVKAIHSITISTTIEGEALRRELDVCKSTITQESLFLSEQARKDLLQAIQLLNEIYISSEQVFPKAHEIDHLISSLRKNIAVVISEDEDISCTRRFIETYCVNKSHSSSNIIVMYPNEYINAKQTNIDSVVVAGWLGRSVMEKILYSYNASNNYVLIYDCETVWRNAHIRRWDKVLREERLQGVENELFNVGNPDYLQGPNDIGDIETTIEDEHEQEGIEYVLKTGRYRSYEGEDKEKSVMATPVSFVGGYLAFYTSNHTVISVTDIIEGAANDFEQVHVQDLHIGDFVVIRESSRDLIRDVADQILEANEMTDARSLASKWKESLEVEMIFSAFEDVYKRIKDAGCTKSEATVKNWISDDEMIIPRDRDDLKAIAIATNDDVLRDRLDEVFDAGSLVKKAHIKAGRVLAEKMKHHIVEKISSEEIDPFNIWGPVDIAIEGIGTVKILKIIDIDKNTVSVSDHYTNRLLSEEKEVLLWQE